MDRQELKAARAAKVKTLMDEKNLSVADVIEKLDIADEGEIKLWQGYLYNLRAGNAGLSVERAQKLAPVLGVQVEDLLIEYTNRELGRINAETPAPATTQVNTMSPETLKKRRGEQLDLLMIEKQLSASQLAAQLEEEEYQASLLAMKIAEYRQGEELIPAELCRKIGEKTGVDPVTIYLELLPEEAPRASPPPAPRTGTPTSSTETAQQQRRGRKPHRKKQQSAEAPRSQKTPTERQSAVAEEVGRITLSPADYERIFGFCKVAILQEGNGYAIRLPINKDEMIRLLLAQLNK